MSFLKRFRTACTVLCMQLVALVSYGQQEVPVDYFHGNAVISIPFYTITSHELSEPINLVYDAKGLRAGEPNSHAGQGWTLTGGGSITREVRGLPDDFIGGSGDGRKGWLYTNGTTGIDVLASSFPNTSDLSVATCTDETADHNNISTTGTYSEYDTEPDLFTFTTSDISGSFVFDNSASPQIKLLSHQDIKIDVVYTSAPTNMTIKSFTITTNKGVKYLFDGINTETRYTQKLTSEGTVELFKTQFELFNKAKYAASASYVKDWALSQITSAVGDRISFGYTVQAYSDNDTTRAVVYSQAGSYVEDKLYVCNLSGSRLLLASVSALSGLSASVTYDANYIMGLLTFSDSRRSANVFKAFTFSYLWYQGKAYLESMQQIGANGIYQPPYKFAYKTSSVQGDTKAQDFWGYYNGRINTTRAPKIYVYPSLAPSERYRIYPITGYSGTTIILDGADRTPNPAVSGDGCLTAITYPWNQKMTLGYECNSFYDPVSGADLFGPGVRISTLTYEDLLNPDSKIVQTYSYVDASGHSTGRIVHPPAFAVSSFEYRDPFSSYELAYSTEPTLDFTYKYMTIRSTKDLYQSDYDGEMVGYQAVTVQRSGSGTTKYEYLFPGTYGGGTTSDWSPTQQKFARSSACPTMGIVTTSDTRSFPFAPDPNYDYERGLLFRVSEYKGASTLVVRETNITYQYLYTNGTAPTKVWAYRYEKFPNSDDNTFFFGKYYLLTGATKVQATQIVKTYDATGTNSASDITTFQYNSTAHHLLTNIIHATPDGNSYKTYFKYPLDYGTVPSGADVPSQMIGLLQSNFMNGTPIETYSTLTRSGGGESVINGSIVTFNNNFGSTNILPEFQYSLNISSPVLLTNFQASKIDPTTKLFTPYGGYEKKITFLEYDLYGYPKASVDQSNMPNSTFWLGNVTNPLLSVQNARLNQVAFSDFDKSTALSFTLTNNTSVNPTLIYGAGHTGAKSVYQGIKLSKQLNKSYSSYIFSGWWNNGATSLSLAIVVKNTAKTTTYLTKTYTVPKNASLSPWSYFAIEIPISSAITDFYIEISPSATSTVFLDDISLYPANAIMSTAGYDFPFGTSFLIQSDRCSFIEYDDFGRIKIMRDKDGNIIERRNYQFNLPQPPKYIQTTL